MTIPNYFEQFGIATEVSYTDIEKRHNTIVIDFAKAKKSGDVSSYPLFLDQNEAYFVLKEKRGLYKMLLSANAGTLNVTEKKRADWENQIKTAAAKGRRYGEEIAQQPYKELLRLSKGSTHKKNSVGRILGDIFESITDFFTFD